MQRHTSWWIGLLILILIAVAGYWAWVRDEEVPQPVGENQEGAAYPLEEGEEVAWLGAFRDSEVMGGAKTFDSAELGISLRYPADHLLFEDTSDASEDRTITIGPEDPLLDAIANPTPTEAPRSIYLIFHHDPQLAVANIEPLDYLMRWMEENPEASNLDPDDPEYELATTTVSGVPAYTYHTSMGLYDSNDYIAFIHREWVVIGSVFDSRNGGRGAIFEDIIASIVLEP